MKRKSIIITMIVLACIVFSGCGPKATPPPEPTATPVSYPTGVFTKANWTMEIYADGTSRVYQQYVDSTGAYTVNGDQISVTDEYCKDIVGTYTWSYDGEVLSFTVIEDKCMDRKNQMHQSNWRKKT